MDSDAKFAPEPLSETPNPMDAPSNSPAPNSPNPMDRPQDRSNNTPQAEAPSSSEDFMSSFNKKFDQKMGEMDAKFTSMAQRNSDLEKINEENQYKMKKKEGIIKSMRSGSTPEQPELNEEDNMRADEQRTRVMNETMAKMETLERNFQKKEQEYDSLIKKQKYDKHLDSLWTEHFQDKIGEGLQEGYKRGVLSDYIQQDSNGHVKYLNADGTAALNGYGNPVTATEFSKLLLTSSRSRPYLSDRGESRGAGLAGMPARNNSVESNNPTAHNYESNNLRDVQRACKSRGISLITVKDDKDLQNKIRTTTTKIGNKTVMDAYDDGDCVIYHMQKDKIVDDI